MTRIAIVTGSVRPGRQSLDVARWVRSLAERRTDATFEIVDIADFTLPVWDDVAPPAMAPSSTPHGQAWSRAMDQYDGYVFVVSEYNHSITGALKNALDYLYLELSDKAAGFVSYGSAGGVRAVEHLRGILSEMRVAHVRNAVTLPLSTDFENYTTFTPTESSTASVEPMLDQLVAWATALESVRQPAVVTV
ncbi:NAD(P)H-dependent oxidoreductase [Georgenia sp. 311]|uniref:NAD(P)H-dependent oxidoreductase n=1 Tax=Georgenia wutianyii TaxID=2585135 RepID=A0ABX5VI94_9MICO|nr:MULTISPECIES: NAD(P)H-dependent oxidoreductase [Georgenia]QDB77989.1 NAD(P)H-dependent oxidoreductase [Georgenia wutianyii]TNC17919.1 NAD(P)H-dependent oxidoreductase [Georgenia sp. 311]